MSAATYAVKSTMSDVKLIGIRRVSCLSLKPLPAGRLGNWLKECMECAGVPWEFLSLISFVWYRITLAGSLGFAYLSDPRQDNYLRFIFQKNIGMGPIRMSLSNLDVWLIF